MSTQINLPESWLQELKGEFDQDYMKALKAYLLQRSNDGATIYPPAKDLFSAFHACPLDQLKVVILGQDPYHGPRQAHGMCFSVRPGVAVPPSLRNIYKELNSSLGMPIPNHGYLQSWAQQGVFLLNTVLTVEQGQARSHWGKGWEQFTTRVIEVINAKESPVVFLLWGRDARSKSKLIDGHKHLILESAHPSPLSVRGFIGNGHFLKTNSFLEAHGQDPIRWDSLMTEEEIHAPNI